MSDAFDAAGLARLLAGSRAPLKAALLDQGRIAGLGNIYVCEALHRAGLSPRRRAGSLVKKGRRLDPRLVLLTASIRAVLDEAIAAGGSSLRDYAGADGAGAASRIDSMPMNARGNPAADPAAAAASVGLPKLADRLFLPGMPEVAFARAPVDAARRRV